jgi:hypothetical protein
MSAMAEGGFVTRNSLLLFLVLAAAGVFGLLAATGRIEGYNFRGLIHLSAFLLMISGIMLMWRSEHQK